MVSSTRRAVFFWLTLAALWLGTLGVRPLTHPDEGRYSEISREMAQSGDWVTPRLNGLKYFEKPPLQYWASAAAFRAFGESDWVARLWTGLCGFGVLLLVWSTARRLWGDAVAHYAAICAAGMTALFVLSRVVTLDMSVTFFLTLALCGFLRAQHDGAVPSETRRWMLIVWAALAGALLSKGLIGIVLPGAVLVLYSLLCRSFSMWPRMRWWAGLALFALLAAPWHVLVALRNPEWASFYFIHEHFERFLTNEAHRVGAWYYFVPILLAGLLPWTSLLPQALKLGWQQTPQQKFQVNRFLLIWCGFVFVFFSCSGSKLPGYILPVFPALALLLAQVLTQMPGRTLRWHALILSGLLVLVSIAAPLYGQHGSARTPAVFNAALMAWVAPGAALGALLSLIAAGRALAGRTLAACALLTTGSLVLLMASVMGYRAYAPLSSGAALAQRLSTELGMGAPLFSVAYYDQTLPFYLKRTVTLVDYVDEFALGKVQEPQRWVHSTDAFMRLWPTLPRAVAVMSPDAYAQLRARNLPMRVIDENPRRIAVAKP